MKKGAKKLHPMGTLALSESIEHWKRVHAVQTPTDAKIGPGHCALCKVYFRQPSTCDGCPVMRQTGMTGCTSTPYHSVHSAMKRWDLAIQRFNAYAMDVEAGRTRLDAETMAALSKERKLAREAFKTASLKEIKFLESLV